MPRFCCAGGCTNSTDTVGNFAFHRLPMSNKKLLNVWITKMHRDPRYFNINKHTTICSAHFISSDYINPHSDKKRLKKDSVPSVFKWTVNARHTRTSVVSKLQKIKVDEKDETDTASENDGDDFNGVCSFLSRKTQTDRIEGTCCQDPCDHRFTAKHLKSKCNNEMKEKEMFMHFCGFPSYSQFKESFIFVLPNGDRKNLVYWTTAKAKLSNKVSMDVFNSESDGEKSEMETNINKKITLPVTRYNHIISTEDEYFLFLMKLRMGISNLDIAERFNIHSSTVSRIILTWANYLYIILESLKIWPHRDIILKHSPSSFSEKYPRNIIIIDATEIKVETPSSLQKQTECYSSYKSATTMKALIGVDALGGVMFISHLYEGSISDKELVKRSGFLTVLQHKIDCGEIQCGDTIMADKGFDINQELQKLHLGLNIPPFLKNKPGFAESDVLLTQEIAQHRIHVERAICKIRRFKMFQSLIPVTMFGSINQLWTVACFLSNFQPPILYKD